MRVFISVISHGHGELIAELDSLKSLAKEFFVVVKNNIFDNELIRYLGDSNVNLIDDVSLYGQGFGHNNNTVFEYCLNKFGMSQRDYFLVLNPDVIIDTDSIKSLIESMYHNDIKLGAVNLYLDKKMTMFDPSIRTFPSFLTFSYSILGFGNRSILDKDKLHDLSTVDWAAGSFLMFKVSHYSDLNGFDINYFMYCEDVDICFRSKKLSCPVTFFKNVTAIHLAQQNSRKIFSKHFYWHLKGSLKFLIRKNFS